MTAAGQVAPRRRARVIAVVAVALLAAGAAVSGALGLGGSSDADAGAGQPATTAVTVAVERRTLTRSVSIDGKIDYGASAPLPVKATGTITWLPAPGTVVSRGQPLLRVDDRPVVLLYGDLPHYRALAAARKPDPPDPAAPPQAGAPPAAPQAGTGGAAPAPTTKPSPAKKPAPPPPFTGNDVEQFEGNLRKLGYSGFDVDKTFSDSTTRAVKRWQRDLGLPPTGAVGLGDVVYAAGAVRIATTNARVGGAVSDETVAVSGNNRVVTAAAPTESLAWAKNGARVSVKVPDGGESAGTVASVGAPSAGGKDGGENSTVPITVTVKDQKALQGQAGAPVTVTHVAEQREDVLCVPVPALVALAEGGYGLERADPGAAGFIAVKTGMFADGVVEVSGAGLSEGMNVRAPK
ncbi:MAG TPA: peptidoglycan-binding domain-containing protein [Catenuloplanes sp.]|jgi:peptidoglycan hydrolase-like protein with peptidoglycan-binding domain